MLLKLTFLSLWSIFIWMAVVENECIDFASMCKKYHIIENLVNHAFKFCRKWKKAHVSSANFEKTNKQ